jgi:branched-subunit amino acid transport protein
MTHNIWIYILIAFGVSYLIRVLPLTLIRRPITNPFLRSFLFYVPYATLAVMTFPAITETTLSPYSGFAALFVGILLAWNGKKLPVVAAACCITVFITEFFLA